MKFLTLTEIDVTEQLVEEIRVACESDDEDYANLSKSRTNRFPISFSWPGNLFGDNLEKLRDISTTFPGKPYSFSSYADYLNQYETSRYAVTFKKGGWDCFRHLEILRSGAIPFMPDIDFCPKGAMSHYPKHLLSLATRLLNSGNHVPENLSEEIHHRFRERLSSVAMARFILSSLRYEGEDIVFLDPGLASYPDYLSVMCLVGLKRHLDPRKVNVPFGAAPVYRDWLGDTSKFHGLGFGYTKILNPDERDQAEFSTQSLDEILSGITPSPIIMVGDIQRNKDLADYVSHLSYPKGKKAFIWGFDRSPDRRQRLWIEELQGMVFIREEY